MDSEKPALAFSAPASGIIWVYRFREDGSATPVPGDAVETALSEPGGWTWVHVGLADTRARTWLMQHAPLSDGARAVLAGEDEHMRLDLWGTEVVGIVPELTQTLARPGEDLVRLRFALTECLLITSRRSPVHALEATRRSIETGRTFPTPVSFLEAIFDQFASAVDRISETIGERLDRIEQRLMHDDELGDEREQLGRLRLQLVRTHRQLAQVRTLFHRVEARLSHDNPLFGRAIREVAQRFDTTDHDVTAQYERARLLLDEIEGKMAAITNRRLMTLSVLTACLLPPTLVTGFFGMNTKDLPFQSVDGGTWYALVIALGAGFLAYWLLHRLRAL